MAAAADEAAVSAALAMAMAEGVEAAALAGSATRMAAANLGEALEEGVQDALRRRSRRSQCPERRPCTPNQGRHPHKCRCWR